MGAEFEEKDGCIYIFFKACFEPVGKEFEEEEEDEHKRKKRSSDDGDGADEDEVFISFDLY